MNLFRRLRLWIHRKVGFHNFNIADPEIKCVVCGKKIGILIRTGDTFTIREIHK